MSKNNDNKTADFFFTIYSDYARILRTWLVSYGVGGPVLYLTQKEIAQRINGSDYKFVIISLFWVGVFTQILNTVFNKWINYQLYYKEAKGNNSYSCCNKLSEMNWIDKVFDCISIAAFAVATIWVLWIMSQ